HCEKKMKVRDDLVGRRVKCPGCGQAVAVPAEDEERAVIPAPPKGSRPRLPHGDDEELRPRRRIGPSDDEEDSEHPRKKKKGLLLGLCAGGALLVGAVVLILVVVLKKDGSSPGGGERDVRLENNLRMIGLAYHTHCHASGGKGPAKAEDLLPFMENDQRLV